MSNTQNTPKTTIEVICNGAISDEVMVQITEYFAGGCDKDVHASEDAWAVEMLDALLAYGVDPTDTWNRQYYLEDEPDFDSEHPYPGTYAMDEEEGCGFYRDGKHVVSVYTSRGTVSIKTPEMEYPQPV